MMLYGAMYSYQSSKKKECFKMKMFHIFLILISVNISSDSLYGLENEVNETRFNNLIKDIRCQSALRAHYQALMLRYQKT